MRRLDVRLLIGFVLVAAGVVYLLENLNIIRWSELVWAAAFSVAGLLVLGVFVRDQENWWALILGITLLGLAASRALTHLVPDAAAVWSGPIFLGSIGLSFWLVFIVNREFWWAIIPAGVLTTLASVAAMDAIPGVRSDGIFFLGLALTFVFVALASGPRGQLHWAYFPAAVLGVLGILASVGLTAAINYVWPAALILAGLFLVLRAGRRAQ
jgi:hypothetical protein